MLRYLFRGRAHLGGELLFYHRILTSIRETCRIKSLMLYRQLAGCGEKHVELENLKPGRDFELSIHFSHITPDF